MKRENVVKNIAIRYETNWKILTMDNWLLHKMFVEAEKTRIIMIVILFGIYTLIE